MKAYLETKENQDYIYFKDLKDGEMAGIIEGDKAGFIVLGFNGEVQTLGSYCGWTNAEKFKIKCRKLVKGEKIVVG